MDHYHWQSSSCALTKIAGFEWGTGFYKNPTPPEEAARYLREARIEAAHPVALHRSKRWPAGLVKSCL